MSEPIAKPTPATQPWWHVPLIIAGSAVLFLICYRHLPATKPSHAGLTEYLLILLATFAGGLATGRVGWIVAGASFAFLGYVCGDLAQATARRAVDAGQAVLLIFLLPLVAGPAAVLAWIGSLLHVRIKRDW